jgi:hypothetical protein
MTQLNPARKPSFCTVINCMDGRVQLPVISYLRKHFGVEYVDCVTTAGPVRTLAEGLREPVIQSILRRVRISMDKHASVGLAVAGHADCAANPESREGQVGQLGAAIAFLRKEFPGVEIIGLWVNAEWQVERITDSGQTP